MTAFLSASILSADFSNLRKALTSCEQAGVDWIHVDVMDGHFVPNLTMGPFIVETCKRITSLPLDCHLMVREPEKMIAMFAQAGASNLTIHPEENPSILETLELIRSYGCRAGIALNPDTPAEILEPLVTHADLILVMTVHPGYSGQEFMPSMLEKISRVSQIARTCCKQPPIIEVDGGINVDSIHSTQSAGANAFVSASAIFNHPKGIRAGVNALRNSLK